jgi:hypothetical protein
MTKSGTLLLIVGLAAGLWLGFNPATHRQLIRFWDNMRIGQAQAKPLAAVEIHQWDSRVGVWLRSPSRTPSARVSPPVALPGWTQITAAWRAFWSALQGIWVSLLVKIRAGL